MALSNQQQNSLLGVTSFMFDFAPGTESYARFESIIEANPSFYELGTNLAETEEFQSQYDGSTDALINLVFTRLGIQEGTQAYTRGTDFITTRIEQDGIPVGQVLMEVGEKLLQTTPPEGLEDAAATLQNKIAVSQNYLDSGIEGYSKDTIPGLLDDVTADQASVEAAQVKIDAVVNGSGLTEALATLQAAQTAEADFLNEQVDNELLQGLGLDETSSLQNIRDAIDTAASDAAKALSDARALKSDNVLNAELLDAQEALAEAEANVAEVDGLASAVSAYEAAVAASDEADDVQADAEAEAAGATLTFESRNEAADGDLTSDASLQLQVVDDASADPVTYKALTTEPITQAARIVDSGNSNTVLFTVNNGQLELAEGDLSNYSGLAALQSALQSQIDATASAEDAETAEGEAFDAVDALDVSNAEQTAVNEFSALVDDYNTALAAYESDTTNGTSQQNLVDAYGALNTYDATTFPAIADGDTSGTAADEIASSDEAIQTAIETVETGLQTGGDTPLYTALQGEQTDLQTAQTNVEDRETLIETRDQTETLNTQADALAEDVAEADATLTDSEEDGGLGVTLLAGADNFTSGDDVYLYAESANDQSLSAFGDSGQDRIYFGEEFSLVEIAEGSNISDSLGAADALEIFWEQDGNNLNLYVENETFGGNSSGTDEVTQITLTGVNAEEINFTNGYLTAGEIA